MRELLQELPLGFASLRKDDFRYRSPTNLSRCVENALPPSFCHLAHDHRLAQHRVAGPITIEYRGAHIAQHTRDDAFAARDAADKAEDEHAEGSGFGV